MKTLEAPVVARRVHVIASEGGKARRRVGKIANSISFDPHPTRTKVLLLAKAAIPAIIVGMMIGRAKAKS